MKGYYIAYKKKIQIVMGFILVENELNMLFKKKIFYNQSNFWAYYPFVKRSNKNVIAECLYKLRL